jgi:MerR family transcriptional regulator, heat shock protein HspR
MRLAMERKQRHLPEGSLKIGAVAHRFNISVDLLRLYECEGLLIPLKSVRGTRYFTEHDYIWIETILRLVRQARLNFAGIRHLLSLLPCWQIRNCGFESKRNCPVISDATRPCWANRAICPVVCAQDCYYCDVYRSASRSEPLQALLVASEDGEKKTTHVL